MVGRGSSFYELKVGALPFIYLGLPIGANAREKKTWQPVLKKIGSRLSSLNSSHSSLGRKLSY